MAEVRGNEIEVRIPTSTGVELAGVLHRPPGPTRGAAIFAHCFTCSKDLRSARTLSAALADHGIPVLRFDFTGLGESTGEFAETTFSTNVADLVDAAAWLREHVAPPTILVGHSLGGSAVLAAAQSIPDAKAVATIGAPADPSHVTNLLGTCKERIEARGEADVELAGRTFTIRKEFLDDLAEQCAPAKIASLKKALLIFHAPFDEAVGIENAKGIYESAKHPKSFVSLDGADHMLSRAEDAAYVASILAPWSARYVPAAESHHLDHNWVLVEGRQGYTNHVQLGHHELVSDEPLDLHGADRGPSPYELLMAALGSCTSMTLRMYADRKKWPLEAVRVKLHHSKIHAKDCEDCKTPADAKRPMVDQITREVEVIGDLDQEQRERLLEIANRCPVHRTLLENELKVRSSLKPATE